MDATLKDSTQGVWIERYKNYFRLQHGQMQYRPNIDAEWDVIDEMSGEGFQPGAEDYKRVMRYWTLDSGEAGTTKGEA